MQTISKATLKLQSLKLKYFIYLQLIVFTMFTYTKKHNISTQLHKYTAVRHTQHYKINIIFMASLRIYIQF